MLKYATKITLIRSLDFLYKNSMKYYKLLIICFYHFVYLLLLFIYTIYYIKQFLSNKDNAFKKLEILKDVWEIFLIDFYLLNRQLKELKFINKNVGKCISQKLYL